jgi:hypothetical protein
MKFVQLTRYVVDFEGTETRGNVFIYFLRLSCTNSYIVFTVKKEKPLHYTVPGIYEQKQFTSQ